jgi:hypothetical protein
MPVQRQYSMGGSSVIVTLDDLLVTTTIGSCIRRRLTLHRPFAPGMEIPICLCPLELVRMMDGGPVVSVAVPAFNAAETISETLQSTSHNTPIPARPAGARFDGPVRMTAGPAPLGLHRLPCGRSCQER